MHSITERALLDLALASCLISFVWGMRHLFVLPSRDTVGMRITAAAGLAFAALHFCIIQTFEINAPVRTFIALVIYSASLLLFWWGVVASGRQRLPACFTSMEPVVLVTAGPYRVIRHPFYASYLLAWAAGALATLHPLLIGSLVTMSILYTRAAWAEEKALLSGIHSSAYHIYRSRTGMLIPLLPKGPRIRAVGGAKLYLAILLVVTSFSILVPAVYIVVEAVEALPGFLFSQDSLPDYRP